MSNKNKAAEREMRRKQVAANLLAGLNYRDMAEALGCSVGTIASDVRKVMDEWRTARVAVIDEWKELQLRRLDRAINAIWDKVTDGDLAAIDRLQKLIEAQAKILGVDVMKIEHSGPDGVPLGVHIYLPDNGRDETVTDSD